MNPSEMSVARRVVWRAYREGRLDEDAATARLLQLDHVRLGGDGQASELQRELARLEREGAAARGWLAGTVGRWAEAYSPTAGTPAART